MVSLGLGKLKIFRIKMDVNVFQQIIPVDESVWATNMLEFDCVSKKENWNPPGIYVFNPKLIAGNFPYLCPGAIVFDDIAYDGITDILEMAGEILPLPFNKQKLYVLNVLQCVNALDDRSSLWKTSKETGAKLRLERYSFFENRFSESSLFKIPETSRGEVLTFSGLKDPEDELISRYHDLGLKGLVFNEVWSS